MARKERRRTRRERPLAGDPNDPEGLHVWTGRYLGWLAVRNYAKQTIRNRRSYLSLFIAWAEARGLSRPQDITKPILERYQRHLFHLRQESGKPLSFRAQHSRLVPIRGFFKWLTRQNVILSNPASELELPRLERQLPHDVLTANEAERVLAEPDTADPLGLRDRAMLETLYSTGIRRMELINLSVWDLDVERGTMLIRLGKGNRDRVVPIGERAIAWIRRYLDSVRPQLVVLPDDGTLFLSSMGERLSPDRATHLARGYVIAADIGKTGACHLFRHSMATLMLEGGADIRFIQELLGHVELSTTQIYTQVSIRQLKEVHTRTHPAAMLDRPTSETPADTSEQEAAELMADLDADDEEQLE